MKEEIQSEHFQERWARNMARNIEREMFDEDENERFEGHFDIQLKSNGFKKRPCQDPIS